MAQRAQQALARFCLAVNKDSSVQGCNLHKQKILQPLSTTKNKMRVLGRYTSCSLWMPLIARALLSTPVFRQLSSETTETKYSLARSAHWSRQPL
ncbi:hypothetical protein [Brucella anthropi]|uniref:hypothetical protein n=1 Tax=Brucella anthropi TaxID=529 RepID=UPI0034E5CD02